MVIVLIGVAGAGKTRIGRMLASELGWRFCDADEYHPSANIAKMRAGIALTDDDREPWLRRLRDLVVTCIERGENAILACSALKAAYRKRLQVDPRQVTFIYLYGSPALLAERLMQRRGHFMPVEMLESQLATLEEPIRGLRVSVDDTPEAIVRTIRSALGL